MSEQRHEARLAEPDETVQQTFELKGAEIIKILVALEQGPKVMYRELSRMFGRPYESPRDFKGAIKALYDQRQSMRDSAGLGAINNMGPAFKETTFSVTLTRGLWLACYHALIWSGPDESMIRLKISGAASFFTRV